jgi:hypothetical protein
MFYSKTAPSPTRVQAISETVLRAVEDDTIVAQLSEQLRVVPLRLDRSRQTMRREEIQVDVTGDPRRMGFPDGRRIVVPGIRVTVSIPYIGDRLLWRLRPSTYRLSAPRGVVRAGLGDEGALDIVIEQPSDQPIEGIKTELESTLGDIQFFIENQARDLASLDDALSRKIRASLADRRSRLKKHDGLSDFLGIPEISVSPSFAKGSPPKPTAKSDPGADPQWDVFVSHASEDKETLVRALVTALSAAGLRVWYDEHVLRIGDSLRRSIDKGLARSRYGLVIISPAFLSKHWPQKELDGLVAREEEGEKVILPIWHGVSPADVRRASPTLADRLAVSSDRGVDEVVREVLRAVRPSDA